MPEKRHMETIILDNGQELHLFDISRQIADAPDNTEEVDPKCQRVLEGDIYYLGIAMETTVNVEKCLPDEDKEKTAQIADTLGKDVLFQKVIERHLVYESEKDAIFLQMKKEAKEHYAPYIGNPKFAKNLVLKLYADATGPAGAAGANMKWIKAV